MKCVHLNYAELVLPLFLNIVDGETPEVEKHIDGVAFNIHATPMFDGDGKMTSILAVTQNISERNRTEQALTASEGRFRLLFEHSPDGIMLYDPRDPDGNFRIVDANPAACQMHGYTRDELIGSAPDRAYTLIPLRRTRYDQYIQRIRSAGTLQDHDFHRRKDGSIFAIEYTTSLVIMDGVEFVLGIDRDITERTRMEELLRQSEERYRTTVEHAPIGVITVNATGQVMAMNQKYKDILGYEEADLTDAFSVPLLIHPMTTK